MGVTTHFHSAINKIIIAARKDTPNKLIKYLSITRVNSPHRVFFKKSNKRSPALFSVLFGAFCLIFLMA